MHYESTLHFYQYIKFSSLKVELIAIVIETIDQWATLFNSNFRFSCWLNLKEKILNRNFYHRMNNLTILIYLFEKERKFYRLGLELEIMTYFL